MPSAAPFSLTISRNGAGNVFSRPTSSPMTFLAMSPPLPIEADVESPLNGLAHHFLPGRPIVRPTGPDFESDLHPLLDEDRRYPALLLAVQVLRARGDDLRLQSP